MWITTDIILIIKNHQGRELIMLPIDDDRTVHAVIFPSYSFYTVLMLYIVGNNTTSHSRKGQKYMMGKVNRIRCSITKDWHVDRQIIKKRIFAGSRFRRCMCAYVVTFLTCQELIGTFIHVICGIKRNHSPIYCKWHWTAVVVLTRENLSILN